MNRNVVMMINAAVSGTVFFAYGISMPKIIYRDLGFEK